MSESSLTLDSPLAELSVLDEAGKHLGVHEQLEELAHASGRMRLPEGFSVELADAIVSRLVDVQRVMAHQLHKESHKRLRHQSAQAALLCTEERSQSRANYYSTKEGHTESSDLCQEQQKTLL